MKQQRGAGVLLHISSLPGKYGIGSLGKEAFAFAKKLAKCGVKYWQILPLVQTGYGNSPYQTAACNSLNPYFIDLEALYRRKLLTKQELKAAEHPAGAVDYGALYEERLATLRKAFSRFFFDDPEFRAFVKGGSAEDFALFMTAKETYGGSFPDWEEALKNHTEEAVEKLRTERHEEYLFWQFTQYELIEEWLALKDYCNSLGIKIIGDIPLYVAIDSADVWVHAELFKLDDGKRPKKVAGVPPDYFSETGQLWGNPVYDWDEHKKEDYRWWRARLKYALGIYDIVRIDHFRGIDRYYEIEAGAETAKDGEWVDGPKEALFEGFKDGIIAEDLGTLDDGVYALLDKTGFPGMKVLLFAFDGNPSNPFLPHGYPENCVAYTGTHDNDTVVGYCRSLSPEDFILFKSRVAAEMQEMGLSVPLGEHSADIADAFLHLCLGSKAKIAIVPIQDILGLDNDARMNFPGTEEGNWQFRLSRLPRGKDMNKLKKMILKYRR